METENTFFNLLSEINDFGSIKSPDFLAYIEPLLVQVKAMHDQNLCAEILNINQIEFTSFLSLKTNGKTLKNQEKLLFKKEKKQNTLEVVEQFQEVIEVGNFEKEYSNLSIQIDLEKPISEIVYLTNYKVWDLEKGHCDPLTDVFSLGQIMASVAFGLDFSKSDDLEIFVGNRKRLYFLNKNLHPTILTVIFEMTQLYREDRSRNLEEIITKLRNYREYNPENYVDLTNTIGFKTQDLSERSSWILTKLKNRLFDISRRNKLLYFKENASFMNLTVSSFPILLDHQNVKENDLIFWSKDLENKIINSKKLNLNTYLEFQNNGFLAPQLNKIRLDARKIENEYGFSNLKLVVAFLNWYNFKEDAEEKISSPLLLLSTKLVKKKAVNDQYTLEFESLEAEVNPILSNYLKDLYDIKLPDFIYLENNAIEQLIENIQAQISIGNSGIQLDWHQKPRIQIIHKIAQKNFNFKNKKLIKRSRSLNLSSFNYSYHEEDFKPLGLQIFNERIRPKKSELEYIINDDIKPSGNATSEKGRTFYSNNNEGEINPLVWEIDTCNVTLGNFNYRKMSLVRDFNEIISNSTNNIIFDKLFDEKPKKLSIEDAESFSFESNYPIISSDPTQTAAIQFARTGANYIIQGPPGTGKSQTITNLIADYIARDKKILFVCEKRAALDVVFHRLKNRNLDELCCLIHDSQTDKKAFIQNLKKTYESFIDNKLNGQKIENERTQIINALNKEIESLNYFHRLMQQGEVAPLELLGIIHEQQNNKEFPTSEERIYLPNYTEWKQNLEWITEWITQLRNNKFEPFISEYIFAQLDEKYLEDNNPKAKVLEVLESCIIQFDAFEEFRDSFNLNEELNFSEWEERFTLANKIKGIFETNRLEVFDAFSKEARGIDIAKNEVEKLRSEALKKTEENTFWLNKYNAADTAEAWKQWQVFEVSIFRFFKPSFYAFKSKINNDYDFEKHQVKPSITTVLSRLNDEYLTQEKLEKKILETEEYYGLQNLESDYNFIKSIQQNPNKILSSWLQNENKKQVANFINYSNKFMTLNENILSIFGEKNTENLEKIESNLNEARDKIHSLSAFIPFIKESKNVSKEMRKTLFSQNWNLETFAFKTAYKSLQDIYEKDRPFAEINEDDLQLSISKINKLLSQYYNSNVESIRAKIRAQFLDKIRITESVAANLTPDEKISKKTYNNARKILENEFSKSMRYKSIRDLATGDANTIMTNLKPVWLMSPLSVSDTMPIDATLFDVVIYDEASQITVEEGVPAVFRTQQTIIVGDEMQMPPTNFFSTISAIDEDDEDIEDAMGINLDSDSLLNQGTRKLSSVMLGWHYRSRRESLISFSNAAFYERNLLTIPDSKITKQENESLEPISDVFESIDIHQILDKSISYQYIANAVYDNRKNKDEANYIANLVCTLLKEKVKKSIGIVAFSMQQQAEIEAALERLAEQDEAFEILLEEEYQRIDEDSFNGLFVKNLENVQGDERDIIIMSVCYGHNESGKMLMNFGPINRKGGEKRLNVIFSRAKQNMIVVSSIMPQEIKNDYNLGANYFKKFLMYAKYISEGKLAEANLILDGLFKYDEKIITAQTALTKQIATAIKKMNYEVDFGIGQSHFKCDIGVRSNQDTSYKLGILIDSDLHYSNENVLEQYCQKPEILEAFGWETLHILSKDWLENPERVLSKIQQRLEGNFKEEIFSEIEITESIIEEITKLEKIIIEEIKVADSTSGLAFERYEFTKGTSNKFWQIALKNKELIVAYGRIGNQAQTNLKQFENEQIALIAKEKMIATKVAKGYLKVE